jgi:protein-S-isoprenylcysteine O-methyltransferase Ste14
MYKNLSIVGLAAMVIGLLGLMMTNGLWSGSALVIAVQVAAVLLMIWARVTFGRRSFHAAANPTPGGLVNTGPYHYIRHPIYTAILVFCWIGVIANWSLFHVLLALLLLAGAAVRMACEETILKAELSGYRQYAETTKRIIPYIY